MYCEIEGTAEFVLWLNDMRCDNVIDVGCESRQWEKNIALHQGS